MRLTQRVDEMVVEALAAATLGEEMDHEVTLTLTGQLSPMPSILILIIGRGIAIDEVVAAAPILIPTPLPTSDVVTAHVQRAVAQIQDHRAQQTRKIQRLFTPLFHPHLT